jgi:hypothetical protein
MARLYQVFNFKSVNTRRFLKTNIVDSQCFTNWLKFNFNQIERLGSDNQHLVFLRSRNVEHPFFKN